MSDNGPRIETILHTVLKFQFDRARFRRREASANFDVSNNIVSVSPTHIQ